MYNNILFQIFLSKVSTAVPDYCLVYRHIIQYKNILQYLISIFYRFSTEMFRKKKNYRRFCCFWQICFVAISKNRRRGTVIRIYIIYIYERFRFTVRNRHRRRRRRRFIRINNDLFDGRGGFRAWV